MWLPGSVMAMWILSFLKYPVLGISTIGHQLPGLLLSPCIFNLSGQLAGPITLPEA